MGSKWVHCCVFGYISLFFWLHWLHQSAGLFAVAKPPRPPKSLILSGFPSGIPIGLATYTIRHVATFFPHFMGLQRVWLHGYIYICAFCNAPVTCTGFYCLFLFRYSEKKNTKLFSLFFFCRFISRSPLPPCEFRIFIKTITLFC